MPRTFAFDIAARDGAARTGAITMDRGTVRTPAFMPVGTAGTVKAMFPSTVKQTGAEIVLGNTYHLMLRPTAERIFELGGLHKFMCWDGPILTDSGGFQVMSLAGLRKIDPDGVTFKSHIDGSEHRLTPERAIQIQNMLGSDIVMQLDECVALPATQDEMSRAVDLSLDWAQRCMDAFDAKRSAALFAIVQGGDDPVLREKSATALKSMNFKGYAVGGLAVGEPQEDMFRVLEETVPFLPDDAPHYLMGVGTPDDILGSVERGIDMFDCVMPTRAGRHGQAFTRLGKLNLKNARHANDPRPIDEQSSCEAARMYSRAYLHHLVKSGEPLGGMILSWINVAYYQELMGGIRAAIGMGRFNAFSEATRAAWARGDLDIWSAN